MTFRAEAQSEVLNRIQLGAWALPRETGVISELCGLLLYETPLRVFASLREIFMPGPSLPEDQNSEPDTS
jgi:hypothetical protein